MKESMTSQEWVGLVEQLIESRDWPGLESLNQRVCQDLIDSGDVKAMLAFYQRAVDCFAGAQQLGRIIPGELSSLKSDMGFVLQQAIRQSQQNPDVQAIYMEYHYDGGDSTELNVFLSEKHPTEDPEYWGSYFGENGFIEGPNVHQLFHFDPYGEFSDLEETITTQYVRSHIIAVLLSVIEAVKLNLSIGFAAHDGSVVMLSNEPA